MDHFDQQFLTKHWIAQLQAPLELTPCYIFFFPKWKTISKERLKNIKNVKNKKEKKNGTESYNIIRVSEIL